MIKIEEIVQLPTPLQLWDDPLFNSKGVKVWIKRDDLSHSVLSGNKARKLKYNLIEANCLKKTSLVSFGGAYSNHLYAMAGIRKFTNWPVRMIIRGDELNESSSPTLSFAHECGVELIFVSRSEYRDKAKLTARLDENAFVIPEGGSNQFCLQGVSEMVDEIIEVSKPTHIAVAMGTGGTLAGICSNQNYQGHLIGVPALKGGEFLAQNVNALTPTNQGFDLWADYHFGGYAKTNEKLINFIKNFEGETRIPIEQVYTAKLFFAVKEKVLNDYFEEGSNVVVIHSGGLQGKDPTLKM